MYYFNSESEHPITW